MDNEIYNKELRKQKQERWAREYFANAHSWYEALESRGINTSISKIKRQVDDIPLIIQNQTNLVSS